MISLIHTFDTVYLTISFNLIPTDPVVLSAFEDPDGVLSRLVEIIVRIAAPLGVILMGISALIMTGKIASDKYMQKGRLLFWKGLALLLFGIAYELIFGTLKHLAQV